MFFFQLAVIACLVAVVYCAPAPSNAPRDLPALRHEEIHDKFGQYALRYITAESK